MSAEIYHWSAKDKLLYAISMIPFIIVFVGTAWYLATVSGYLFLLFIGLYLAANLFQAGCCVGCPYRGRYCPALCGVYLGNIFSTLLYRNRSYEPRFFERNAAMAETLLLVLVALPLYWIFQAAWYYVPLYLGLLAAHFLLFMPTQCEKCSYNTICPGGIAWMKLRRR
jgi:hypothetical protein